MSDLKSVLERSRERIGSSRLTPDRVYRRRERKERTRRISATVLSIVIAFLSLTALTRAFDHGPKPGSSPTPPISVGASRLAFGLGGDIYLADANGSHRVRIATGVTSPGGPGECGTYWGEGPMWSPDGRYLAFRGSVDQGGSAGATGWCASTVTIADQTGQIISTFRVGLGWQISWSPDSTRVAVWAPSDDVAGDPSRRHIPRTIGIYGIDGALQKVLTVPPGMMAGGGDIDPVWSHDGQSLLLPWIEVPIDGSPPRDIPAGDPRSYRDLTYSPDGTRVAYVDDRGGLDVAAADGSSSRVLLDDAYNPVWSPSGDLIAFELAKAPEIRVVDVATGAVTSLVRMPSSGNADLIGFSPDGARVLFFNSDAAMTDPPSLTSLWSVRTDGSDPQLLVKGTVWGQWQP